jgi:prepilin-type N-terminal cleavage/methylation domain-containing protein
MRSRGFTLIELIMVVAIVGVLAAGSASIMIYLVQNSVFVPNKLNMDMLAQNAIDIMIEGDKNAEGLRFSRTITAIQPYQVTFINQDGLSVRYRLDTGTSRLYRSISGGAEALIPYYIRTGTSITGKSGALFTYYDANDAVTGTAANVRRIRMILIAKTGTGQYADWEGQSEQASSVAVKRLQ